MKPQCECHGESMYWAKDARWKTGGRWHCAVNHREDYRRRKDANPERIRAANREASRRYRVAHSDEVRASERKRREAHPDTMAAYSRRRRARKAGVESDGHTRAEVWERDGGVCQLCVAPLDPRNWHEDHIIPLSAGGPDTLENVQASCPPCNLAKGAKVI